MRIESVTEEVARAWLLQVLHPGGMTCPWCISRQFTDAQAVSWSTDRRVRCSCGRWFGNRTGTLLDKSALWWSQVAVLLHKTACRIPVAHIATDIGCSVDTVIRMQRRFKGAA